MEAITAPPGGAEGTMAWVGRNAGVGVASTVVVFPTGRAAGHWMTSPPARVMRAGRSFASWKGSKRTEPSTSPN